MHAVLILRRFVSNRGGRRVGDRGWEPVHVFRAEADDEGRTVGNVFRIQRLARATVSSGATVGPSLTLMGLCTVSARPTWSDPLYAPRASSHTKGRSSGLSSACVVWAVGRFALETPLIR